MRDFGSVVKAGRLVSFILVMVMVVSPMAVMASEPSDWAAEEIGFAEEMNAVTQALAQDYQANLTRDAFAELLVKSYESVTDEIVDTSTLKNPFTDTEALYVLKAYSAGIIRGTSPTTFSPEDYVTREQMVVMFVRMVEAVEAKRNFVIFEESYEGQGFADDALIADYAKDSIYKALANGIISGDGINQMNPQNLSTSEQAIVINYRLVRRIIDTNKISIMWRLNFLDYEEAVREAAELTLGDYESSDRKAFVIADILNMRSQPVIDEEGENIIRKLVANEEVVILEDVGDWYKIVASGEMLGYVHSDYLHEFSPDEDIDDIRMQIVAYAKQYIGTPYTYAGNSLTDGIDCSAFTKQVVRPFGYVLQRSSSGQGSDGVAIAEADLLPGDLVTYGYSGSISHVALYIGDGEVIHATTSRGVIVTDMDGYLNKPIISFRRIVF